MARYSSSEDSESGRSGRSKASEPQLSCKPQSSKRSRSALRLTSLRGALSRSSSEAEDVEPTVYLVIHDTKPEKHGLSWTIRIRVPDAADYIFDIVADPKSRQRFHVHEERPHDAILNSRCWKTIKIGTVPANGREGGNVLPHLVHRFQAYELDRDKPHGVSIIWATQVLKNSEKTGLLRFEKDAVQKMEQQTRQMEKQSKALQAAGHP